MASTKTEETTEQPSNWWKLEQRVKIAVKNKKHESISEPMSRGHRLAGIVLAGAAIATAGSFLPVLGPVAGFFLSAPLQIAGVVLGGLSLKGYHEALFNENTDKFVDMKTKQWQQNKTPSVLAQKLGTALKYGINGIRATGALAATAGLAVASATGIATYGAGTAIAETTAMTVATQALTTITATLGVINPVLLIAGGVIATSAGALTAIKGKKVIYNLGSKLQKSTEKSRKSLPNDANIIRKISNNTLNSVRGFSADVFNVAAAKNKKPANDQKQSNDKKVKQKKALTK